MYWVIVSFLFPLFRPSMYAQDLDEVTSVRNIDSASLTVEWRWESFTLTWEVLPICFFDATCFIFAFFFFFSIVIVQSWKTRQHVVWKRPSWRVFKYNFFVLAAGHNIFMRWLQWRISILQVWQNSEDAKSFTLTWEDPSPVGACSYASCFWREANIRKVIVLRVSVHELVDSESNALNLPNVLPLHEDAEFFSFFSRYSLLALSTSLRCFWRFESR